jgi:hypothetical protein
MEIRSRELINKAEEIVNDTEYLLEDNLNKNLYYLFNLYNENDLQILLDEINIFINYLEKYEEKIPQSELNRIDLIKKQINTLIKIKIMKDNNFSIQIIDENKKCLTNLESYAIQFEDDETQLEIIRMYLNSCF